MVAPAERKGPAQSGGADTSPNFDVDTRTRPSDLNTRLARAAALLDDDIAVTDAPANRYVAVAVDAFFSYTAARRSLACRSGLRSLAARAPQNPLSRSR
jgi:hypothetical protein